MRGGRWRTSVFIVSLALVPAVTGLAQQAPPPAVRYDEHANAGGTPPPAATLKNPFAGDSMVAAEGQKLFEGFNCAACHGGVTGAMGPSIGDGRWRYGGSDGAVFHSIFYGRPRGMPAFGGHLPTESIWKVVTYLQSIQPTRDTLATTTW
jgi:cytochrome c oxidase cbb3-type subunit 3